MRKRRKGYEPKEILAFHLMPEAVDMFNDFFTKGYSSTTVILSNCLAVAKEIYRNEPNRFYDIVQKNIENRAE